MKREIKLVPGDIKHTNYNPKKFPRWRYKLLVKLYNLEVNGVFTHKEAKILIGLMYDEKLVIK